MKGEDARSGRGGSAKRDKSRPRGGKVAGGVDAVCGEGRAGKKKGLHTQSFVFLILVPP